MTADHSSSTGRGKRKRVKPTKPYPDYPLFPHASGQWAKKIRGRMLYFGAWSDPDAALAKYMEQRDDLHAGRTPRPDPDAVTVKDVANSFLNAKQELVEGRELSPRTFVDYKEACGEVVSAFGKGRLVADLSPSDFASLRNGLAKKWGLHRLAKTLQCVRSLFKFAYDTELIERPVRFGPGFKKPSKKTFRLHRAAQGQKLFTPEEVHRILAVASPQLKAMVLLGLNCGYGNADVGTLPIAAIDIDAGWAVFPRPKTGMPRRANLWAETIQALKDALAARPEPKDQSHAGLFFITSKGRCFHTGTTDSPLSHEVWKLLKAIGINGGRNFYTFRHTFRTIADGAKDQPAADFVMGHEVAHMSSVYREGIDDARLKAVADHVHAWLFPSVE